MSVERGEAHLSDDGRYRYALSRRWGDGKAMLFIGLNPSTADATKLDPTLRRCVHFAMREGCGALWVGNLFAFRATKPKDLFRSYGEGFTADSPIGSENDRWLLKMAKLCPGHIVCGWGTHGSWLERDMTVSRLLGDYDLQCWGRTLHGHPKHPLYLRRDTPLIPYLPDLPK